MAISIIKEIKEIGSRFILTPERYNPKRKINIENIDEYVKMSDLIYLSKKTLTKNKYLINPKPFYLINTGDANEGILNGKKKFEYKMNSTKKIVNPGNIIISKLRPYLRQIAYIDNNLPNIENLNTYYIASMEFYVLKSKTEQSIAFLIPFLLSEKVQEVFENSVEGNQHPRFKEEDLLNLMISKKLLEMRDKVSKDIENGISQVRSYEEKLFKNICIINNLLDNESE